MNARLALYLQGISGISFASNAPSNSLRYRVMAGRRKAPGRGTSRGFGVLLFGARFPAAGAFRQGYPAADRAGVGVPVGATKVGFGVAVGGNLERGELVFVVIPFSGQVGSAVRE